MEQPVAYNVPPATQAAGSASTVGLRMRLGHGVWHKVAAFDAGDTRKQAEAELACEALGRVDPRFEAQIVWDRLGQALPLKSYSPHTGWRIGA